MKNNYILIGHVANTFGLKGELKITSESDFIEERFKVNATIYFKRGKEYQEHKVTSFRFLKGNIIITIDNLKDINEVTSFIGYDVYASTSSNPVLKDNEYFIDDLVGKEVYNQDDKRIGIVNDMIILPANDLLEIKDDQGNTKLIPFIKEFIISVGETIKIKELEIMEDEI